MNLPVRLFLAVFLAFVAQVDISRHATAAAGEIQSERRDWIVHFLIHFGRGSGANPVSDAQIDEFLKKVVTPFFPEGLTSWTARGQWADVTDGKVTRELSTVAEVQGPDNKETRDKVNFVAKQYIQRFMPAGASVYAVELGRLPATLYYVDKYPSEREGWSEAPEPAAGDKGGDDPSGR